MSAFDPNNVRKAVSEFTPRHQQKFENLLPAKDVIVELRQRQASYRAIAELLTQHCLLAGKTAIANFCHEVLGEMELLAALKERLATTDSTWNSIIKCLQSAEDEQVSVAARCHGPRNFCGLPRPGEAWIQWGKSRTDIVQYSDRLQRLGPKLPRPIR